MLDWRFADKKKIAVFTLGLVALVGSMAILGLTVQRIQNLKPTVTMPKATDLTWPACTKTGSGYTYAGDLSYLQQCCSQVAATGDPYQCTWPARGWCKPEQCPSSGGAHCSLYLNNASSGCVGLGGCLHDSDCVTGYTCQNITPPPAGNGYGKCSNSPNNPCWNPQPIPQNGAQSGDSLTWSWNTNWSSTVNGATVYAWSCSQRTDSCYIGAAGADAASGFTSVKLSAFGGKLQSNTNYFWKVNPNSYSSPDAAHQCMDSATSGWSFNSGAGVSPIPNCTNLTGPATLTVGQKGTYAADFSSPQGNLGGEIFAGQNGTGIWFPGNKGISGNSGSLSFDWTPTAAGTYDVLCRAWNDAVAECRGKANYVDAPPRYACAGPNSSMTVTVSAVASCVTANCPDNQACVQPNNVCLPVICLPIPNQPCKNNVARNHVCQADNVADGTACGATGSGNTCQSGVCTAPGCPTGQTACSGTCKNLQTDNSNCGACGNICASNQTCTSGTCANTSCTTDPDCSGGNVCAFP